MNEAFAFVEQRQERKKANQFQIPTTEWFQMHETLPISKLENFKMKRTERKFTSIYRENYSKCALHERITWWCY